MLGLPDLRASLVSRLLDLRHAFHLHVDRRTRVLGFPTSSPRLAS
jgi:hypothetical protein